MAQTLMPNEIIIVDDGSNDNLENALLPYSTPIIKYIRHETNKGASEARNTGIRAASYEYIAFLDSDDTWRTEKLERQCAFMKKNSLYICCTNFALYRQGLMIMQSAFRPYKTFNLSVQDMAWGCFISPGSTLICQRKLLLDISGYDTSFKRFEDWDLLFRLSHHQPIGWLDESLSDIFVENHASKKSELQGLERMREKFSNKNIPDNIKKIILSSYWFHKATINFKHNKYAQFLMYLIMSYFKKPLNHFPIKAVLLPKFFSRMMSGR